MLEGRGGGLRLPDEPSVRYAAVVGLAARAQSADAAYHAFTWLADSAGPEWLQLYVATLVSKFQAIGQLGELAALVARDERLAALVEGTLAMSEGM